MRMPHLTLRKDAKPVVFAPYHACFASDCVRSQRLSLVFARYHGCLISSPPAPGMRGMEWRRIWLKPRSLHLACGGSRFCGCYDRTPYEPLYCRYRRVFCILEASSMYMITSTTTTWRVEVPSNSTAANNND